MPAVKAAVTRRTPHSPRWDFFRKYKVKVDEKPFIDRWRVQTPLFAVLLTHIHGPDDGRDPHTHSRWFASWILSGGYAECVHYDISNPRDHCYQWHPRWSWHVMTPSSAHVITWVEKPLWTLVIAGRHRGTWHFWTPEGPVDWKDCNAEDDGDA